MTKMTCQELVERVTEFLDGALDEDTERGFVEHLTTCDGCERYLGQFRQTIKSLHDEPGEELPDDVRDTLVDMFRQWTGGDGAASAETESCETDSSAESSDGESSDTDKE